MHLDLETRTRKDYIREQKSLHGRKVMGVFPAQYPRELLLAMNILPVEIWDPPLRTREASAHLQSYICSVVSLGLELILQGKCSDLDAFLFPHTCDSIQNLASIVNDYLGIHKPCYFFYHPKAPYKRASRPYYISQLKELKSGLEKQFGELRETDLKRSVDRWEEIRKDISKCYLLRSEGRLNTSNRAFYSILRRVEYLHPDDFHPLLTNFLQSGRTETERQGHGVLLSGVLPNPPEGLDHFDAIGVRVVDDDLLSCSRRFLSGPVSNSDPYEAMAETYFSLPPCSTRGSAIEERLNHILKKIRSSRADGVIFLIVKFCEPEFFDVPILADSLKKEGIPVLVLENEINQALSGQIVTRIEAFAEMLG